MINVAQSLRSQFHQPKGFLGSVAGWIMANRGSNRDRNLWTVGLLNLQPSDRVLEIGFGPGLGIEAAQQMLPKGFVAGIDHSETMFQQASKRNSAAINEGKVDLRVASVSEIPPYDKPFDVVFAVNSMMFWPEPLATLQRLRKLLRVGGKIALTHQPRSKGATDETARKAGEEIAVQLKESAYGNVRSEWLSVKPVSAIRVLGWNLT